MAKELKHLYEIVHTTILIHIHCCHHMHVHIVMCSRIYCHLHVLKIANTCRSMQVIDPLQVMYMYTYCSVIMWDGNMYYTYMYMYIHKTPLYPLCKYPILQSTCTYLNHYAVNLTINALLLNFHCNCVLQPINRTYL